MPGPAVIALPVPIEPLLGAEQRDLTAVAYAANPTKRGLELLCDAWRLAGPPAGQLTVGGIDRDQAERWLRRAGLEQPPGVQWVGALSRPDWLARVARARIFVNASRYEDWGIAQLEALALARRLAPELVAGARSASALAGAIRAGLALTGAERAAYATAAQALLEPYRPEVVRRTLAEEVVPELLRSSS